MDYAFAPGSTSFDGLLRQYALARANTNTVKATKSRNTAREFIQYLDSTPSIVKPVEDLLFGSHANAHGYLKERLFDRQIGDTGFEVAEDAIAGRYRNYTTPPDTTKTSIEIPASLIGYVDGDPASHHFHIKGCNVGKATPFLQKLKEALGGNVLLTAPLHFYGLYWARAVGVWEYLAYEFRLLSKTPFTKKTDLVDAFDSKGFSFYNGDPIALTDWNAWIPKKINKKQVSLVSLPLGTTIGKRKTVSVKREFRYTTDNYVFTVNFPNAAAVPGGAAARRAALETAMDASRYRKGETIGCFDDAHPYPEYERWGYESKQDFLDEHDWKFTQSGKRLIAKGRFYSYTLLIPIVDRIAASAGNILFNFHPKTGSAIPAITTGLVESDDRFFATV